MQKASRENYYYYNPKLKETAKALRKSMNKAEAAIWKYALKARFLNLSFKRQRPIGPYIVDFVCLEKLLVIEVDGETHTWQEVAENDYQRDEFLKSIGFTVLRFTNEEVLNGMSDVIKMIAIHLELIE